MSTKATGVRSQWLKELWGEVAGEYEKQRRLPTATQVYEIAERKNEGGVGEK